MRKWAVVGVRGEALGGGLTNGGGGEGYLRGSDTPKKALPSPSATACTWCGGPRRSPLDRTITPSSSRQSHNLGGVTARTTRRDDRVSSGVLVWGGVRGKVGGQGRYGRGGGQGVGLERSSNPQR